MCELLEGTGFATLSGASLSRHLQVLKHAGVVEDAKRGKQVFYRLRMPCVAEISLCVKERNHPDS